MKKIIKICFVFLVMILFITGCNGKSSEKDIDTNTYKSMIEFNISSNPNFIVVIDKDDNISHLFFLNNDSKLLINSDIEGKSITDGLSILMEKLWNNNYFKRSISIDLINYGDEEVYNTLYEELSKNLVILGVDGSINKSSSTINDLSSKIGIEYSNDKDTLKEIDKYSKNIVE